MSICQSLPVEGKSPIVMAKYYFFFLFFLFLVKIRSENCIIHKRPLKVVLYPWLKRKSRAFTVLKKCTFGFTLISEILSDGL